MRSGAKPTSSTASASAQHIHRRARQMCSSSAWCCVEEAKANVSPVGPHTTPALSDALPSQPLLSHLEELHHVVDRVGRHLLVALAGLVLRRRRPRLRLGLLLLPSLAPQEAHEAVRPAQGIGDHAPALGLEVLPLLLLLLQLAGQAALVRSDQALQVLGREQGAGASQPPLAAVARLSCPSFLPLLLLPLLLLPLPLLLLKLAGNRVEAVLVQSRILVPQLVAQPHVGLGQHRGQRPATQRALHRSRGAGRLPAEGGNGWVRMSAWM